MLHIDAKYVQILGPRLRNFKKKSDYLWNFSCPICGDSSTNQTKARGYIYRTKTDLFYRCHNCQHGTNLGNIIKHIDEGLYKQYVVERYREGATQYNSHKDIGKLLPVESRQLIRETNVLDGLKSISDLPETHPAVKYVASRLIPKQYWDVLYYAPKFMTWVNTVTPNFIEGKFTDHPRLVIPFFNTDGKCFAFQGRAFGKESPKYLTIKLDKDAQKIYGIDRLDVTKKVYMVEGPIDSLFLQNAVASAGSNLDIFISDGVSNTTVIIDNEPRNKEIVNQLDKYIKLRYNVYIPPDNLLAKDINDLAMSGMSQSEIVSLIDSNTFTGIAATLRFTQWRKCESKTDKL